MYWTGVDGSVWSLVDPTHGSVMMPGVRGFSMPPITHYKDKYASVPGSRWRGFNVEEREVFWPIQIFHDGSSQDWIERDRAWWKSLHPGGTGTWTVVQPDGTRRHLRCRFVNDGTGEFPFDPASTGWQNYGITMVAESPFWEGDPVSPKAWITGEGVPFFNGTDLTISPGYGLDAAKLKNDGDEPAYLTWTVTGPATDAQVGVPGNIITIPFEVPEGQTLVIDTNPLHQSARMGGVNKMAQLGVREFAPLPPGDSITLSLDMTGAGSIGATFTPQYFRAW